MTRSTISQQFATSFDGGNKEEICVLGSNGILWLEHAANVAPVLSPIEEIKFGQVPPPREQVDGNVAAFQPLYGLFGMLKDVYVLGRDRNLWLDHSINGKFGQVPPPHEHVDGNVAAFQGLDLDTIYVLGTDGKLWLDHSINGKFGQVPPPREQVDGNVKAFQALDTTFIFVLGSDGNLWLELGPFGLDSISRQQVDGNVAAFQALDRNTVYVLGQDGKLWLEHSTNVESWQVPPTREQVDSNVAAFQALDTNTIYVLGTDGKLWLEHSINGKFGQVPPPREQVDSNVDDFQALDTNTIYVLGTDGKLWLEHSINGKFGQVPPPREQVDGNVSAPLSFGTIRPAYMILTLVYAPPGTNGGQGATMVQYLNGSSTGTTTSTSSSFKDGLDISASVGIDLGVVSASASADFSFSETETSNSSIEYKKSESYQITVPGPATDGIDHGEDKFYLMLNPIISGTVDRKNNASWELGIDGSTMNIQWVAVKWLKNPSIMPPGVKQELDAAGLTQFDYAEILKADPFASGPAAINQSRYWRVQMTLPYEPPVNPADKPALTTYNLQNSETQTSTHTEEVQYGVSITIEEKTDIPFTQSLKTTASFQWTNTNSQSIQNAVEPVSHRDHRRTFVWLSGFYRISSLIGTASTTLSCSR